MKGIEMHADEKYVVFKREDYADNLVDGTTVYESVRALNDAVVIRTQDIFASAGLSAYAHAMRAFAGVVVAFSPELAESLSPAIGYFFDCAQEAEDRLERGECKLPD